MDITRSRSDVGVIKEEDLAVPPGFPPRTCFSLRRLENGDEGTFPMEVDGQSSSACQEQLNACIQTQAEVTQNQPLSSLKIDDAPVFYPSEKEFEDTLNYIANIRPVGERYGLCRIVPPASWRPPHSFDDKLTLESETAGVNSKYDCGSKFTVKSFKKYANDLKKLYFSNGRVYEPPDVEKIEAEYWRLVDSADKEREALRSPLFIKASPCEAADEYLGCGWNLRNIPKHPFSLLPFGCYSDSTALAPRLSIGVCFTSQFWKNEEHHLYSLSYIHTGEPKLWYCVPGRYCFKFLEVARRLSQSSLNPAFLHELGIQIPPWALIHEGISVCKCVQKPNELVLIFPGAYRTEICCGFSCSEASCFAPFERVTPMEQLFQVLVTMRPASLIPHS